MNDKSVYNFTYQELKEKTASSLELLLTNIKIHKLFLEAMQTTGVITEQESKADHNGLVKRIIDFVKEHK
jgi:hypothetical protein